MGVVRQLQAWGCWRPGSRRPPGALAGRLLTAGRAAEVLRRERPAKEAVLARDMVQAGIVLLASCLQVPDPRKDACGGGWGPDGGPGAPARHAGSHPTRSPILMQAG